MDPALQRLAEEGSADDEVAVMVGLAGPGTRLPAPGRTVSRFGAFATARVARGRIAELRAAPGVVSVKASRLYRPELVRVATEVATAERGDERRPEGLAPTGRGVVIGIADWGLDFRHEAFLDARGRTRVVALWDQAAPDQGGRPNRFGYGRIHERRAIDAALRTPDPVATLGYDPTAWDVGGGTHGTATASVAAGSAWANGPAGMAPDAALVFVNLTGAGPLGHSTTLAEAIDFVRRVAGPRPWVMNMSLGRHGGPHDGRTLLEQLMDAAVMQRPGGVIVNSAGNYYSSRVHTTARLLTGETAQITVRISERMSDVHEIDLWYGGSDRMVVGLVAPDGRGRVTVRPGATATLDVGGRSVARVWHRVGDPNNGRNQAILRIEPEAPAGDWKLVVIGAAVTDGRFHAWIEREALRPGNQARFLPDDAVATTTTGTICNGLHNIVVGAFDAHDDDGSITSFSSSGDTVDGRRKPDLLAPGEQVLVARSGAREVATTAAATRMSGTSLAAPFVTGTVACMLEVAGRVSTSRVRAALLRAATPFSGEGAIRAGSGFVDPVAACAAIGRKPRIPRRPATTETAMTTLTEVDLGTATVAAPDELLRRLGMTARGLFEVFVLDRRPSERERLNERVTVVAAAGDRADGLQPGDLLVRGVMGEGRALAATLVTGELHDARAARREDLELEGSLPGKYAWVIEGGSRARPREDRFARRICDRDGFMPLEQTILRLRDEAAAHFVKPGAPHGESLEEAVNRQSREYIRWYQDALNRIDRAGLAVDGVVGPLTRAAVRRYQARKGLAADGIVGPITERALILDGGVLPPGFTGPSPLGITPTTTVRERPNVTTLTPTQLATLANAINELRRRGRYAQFVADHAASMAAGVAHRQPAFLPWHRQFILFYESELRTIDASITLPYWDWANDPGTLAGSPSWNASMVALLGGNGAGAQGAVTTGPFAGWMEFDGRGAVTTTPLRREFGRSVGTLPRQTDVITALNVTPYDVSPWDESSTTAGFRNTLEGWTPSPPALHNRVHVWIGGSMLPDASPNDPVFFLHHCMIDKLWADWQARFPAQTYLPATQQPRGGGGTAPGINDLVPVRGLNTASPVAYRAADTLDLNNLRDHTGATVAVRYR